MQEKPKVKRNRRDPNFLPASVGDAFLRDLDKLISGLSLDPAEGELLGTRRKRRETFRIEYLKSEYRRRFIDPKVVSATDRADAAVKKFMAVEEKNRQTNLRLLIGDASLGYTTSDELLSYARMVVRSVIGECPPSRVFDNVGHTNGASTRIGRGPQAQFLKHAGEAHITVDALPRWLAYAFDTQLITNMEVVRGSVMFTVPKSSEIDRVACKEPEINMLMQRGAGQFIRQALRKVGVNLNDQGVNQDLAKRALTLGLCTIDLSSASDSIARQLVIELLPFEWWSLLDDIRVKETMLPSGDWIPLEMFSSMGNGFTFELESLLFYALVRAIAWKSGVRGRISVYGDDIIAPSKLGPRIQRTFQWFGFTVNGKKSHWRGLFRESCGRHYYDNRDVTPFYLTGSVRSVSEMIRILNRIAQWDCRETGGTHIFTPEIAAFHRKWAAQISSELHGGTCLERSDALVTGDLPRKLLREKKPSLERFERGALIAWLNKRYVWPGERGFRSFGDHGDPHLFEDSDVTTPKGPCVLVPFVSKGEHTNVVIPFYLG